MNKALMDNATKQEWFPEWFFTGAIYADIGILSRAYPAEQSAHAFGLSFLTPFTELDPAPPPPQLPLSTLDRPAELVLGRRRRHAGRRGRAGPDLVADRHPRRGAEAHPEDVRAGTLRDPGVGRRGPEPHEQLPLRIRQGPESAVRRVRRRTASTSRPTGGTPPPRARRTARARWARAWAGTPTAPSATRRARGRRSSSTGSTRTRRCTTSRPARRPRPPTSVTAKAARPPAGPARPASTSNSGFIAKANGAGEAAL